MKDINVKHVLIVAIVFGSIVAVSALGGDVATMVLIGMGVLGGIGLLAAQQASQAKETQVVREQTNGNAAAQLKMMEEQRRDHAAQLDAQRAQFMAIIDWQARMLAQSSVPPEAIAALPAPISPAAPPGVLAGPPPDGYPRQYRGGLDERNAA